jgi:hypothetical protein
MASLRTSELANGFQFDLRAQQRKDEVLEYRP